MSSFRTIEISDPRFEVNNLRFITVKTPNLKGRGDICVFVPPAIKNDSALPVVILLHGVYGSAWSWAMGTGVHLQVMKMIEQGEIPAMIIAMPSDGLWGDGSAYMAHNGYDFEKWIVEDVVESLKEMIDGVSSASPVFICGLSMGGFGALRIGAKYGNKFKGISAHSAITSLEQMKLFVEEDLENYRQQNKTDEDVFETIQKYREQLAPFRFDCGTDDLLIEHNRKLHQMLTSAGIEHSYEENPGSHEWPYWEKHIGDSLRFFGKLLLTSK
ncbi:MAG: prolyl oligopeptidase family serine peptidase [Bacteroidetes bacterium]|nr:prolyl oligopeptidase family serine peptidase [Bacteroidota bacterium]